MTITRILLLSASLGLGLLLTSCGGRSLLLSSDAQGDDRRDGLVQDMGKKDAGPRLDRGPYRPDLPRADGDPWPPDLSRLDLPIPVFDRGVDLPKPVFDRGVIQPDRSVVQPDRGVDLLQPYPDQGFSNDDCYSATYLSFSQGSVTVQGTTADARDDVLLTTVDCTGYSTAGPDVYYQLQLKVGYRYRLELTTPSFNGALYLFSRCDDPAGTCGSGMGADQYPAGNTPERILFAPPATATYLVGVDGRTLTDKGSFTLIIKEELLPANDLCENALPLALLGGYTAVDGDTSQAMNAFDLEDMICIENPWSSNPSNAPDTPGADLFYSVSLVAGNSYLVTATPRDWDYSPSIYMFTSCAQPKQTCVAGAAGDFPGMSSSFTYTPTTSGTYNIAVDSIAEWGMTYAGPFTLEVKTPP